MPLKLGASTAMRYVPSWSILVLIVTSAVFAAAEVRKPVEITGSGRPVPSPDGRLELFWRRSDPNGPHEIWLRSSQKPTEQTLVYAFNRSASVLWSPNSALIAITDRQTSDETRVRVFRVLPALVVLEIKDAARYIDETFFLGKDGAPIYGHSYAGAVRWSKDSDSLEVEVRAYDALDGSQRKLRKKVWVKFPPLIK